MQIAQHTFLVTGGASGLGAASVRQLAASGANVVVADRSLETGENLAKELGAKIAFVPTDVTNEESARAAIEAAISRFGAIRGLVNCAGILGAARIVGREGPHDLALFQKVIQ